MFEIHPIQEVPIQPVSPPSDDSQLASLAGGGENKLGTTTNKNTGHTNGQTAESITMVSPQHLPRTQLLNFQ